MGEEQDKIYEKKKVVNMVNEKGTEQTLKRRTRSKQQGKIENTGEGRTYFWVCGKQHETVHLSAQ